MTTHLSARASVRALCGAVALGSVLSLAIGGAYILGDAARASGLDHPLPRGAAAPALRTGAPSAQAAVVTPALKTTISTSELGTPVLVPAVAQAVPPVALRQTVAQSDDLECLSQAVYYEARGESDEGQAAVAQVVLNRARHPRFPHSVCGVVFQHTGGGCQFSFACDGQVKRSRETPAWKRAQKVAARALDGYVMADVGAATDFRGQGQAPARLLRVAQIGGHVFYRFAGRLGAAQVLRAEVEPSTAPKAQVVEASFAKPAEALFAASAKAVERAAAAVESVGKAAAAPTAKADAAKADTSAPTPTV